MNRIIRSFNRVYHKKIIDYYENPKNVGSFNKKDVILFNKDYQLNPFKSDYLYKSNEEITISKENLRATELWLEWTCQRLATI